MFTTKVAKEFGSPSNLGLAFGDACISSFSNNTNAEFLQRAFARRGYTCFRVNESCTSIVCSSCHTKSVHRFHKRTVDDRFTVWSLVACTECQKTFNRDCNAARNIHKAAVELIANNTRPTYFDLKQPWMPKADKWTPRLFNSNPRPTKESKMETKTHKHPKIIAGVNSN